MKNRKRVLAILLAGFLSVTTAFQTTTAVAFATEGTEIASVTDSSQAVPEEGQDETATAVTSGDEKAAEAVNDNSDAAVGDTVVVEDNADVNDSDKAEAEKTEGEKAEVEETVGEKLESEKAEGVKGEKSADTADEKLAEKTADADEKKAYLRALRFCRQVPRSPHSTWANVDFPAPLWPITAVISPRESVSIGMSKTENLRL